MLTRLRLRNFKSWPDTGDIALRPITAFFGANSSGKTSLLQALLLLKQTSESSDRAQVFHFGDRRTLVDLGDFGAVAHGTDAGAVIGVELDWRVARMSVADTDETTIAEADTIGYFVSVDRNGSHHSMSVEQMGYRLDEARFRMFRDGRGYRLVADGVPFDFVRPHHRAQPLPPPIRCYGFPNEVETRFRNAGFLTDFEYELVRQLGRVHYLGPLRALPERRYFWTGAAPPDVGRDGEWSVAALLASRSRGRTFFTGSGCERRTLEEQVAWWLRHLDLVHDFSVECLSEVAHLYEVIVRKSATAAAVPLPDAGFGVSRILPVLVLCFYAPEGSTIVLEQPEIYLHPAVQPGLADVLIEAHKQRGLQILIESHSEDLLTRFQRRVADESLSDEKLGLWFCESDGGVSRISRLRMDAYGDIANWPKDFFGDEFGEIAATATAQMRRRQ